MTKKDVVLAAIKGQLAAVNNAADLFHVAISAQPKVAQLLINAMCQSATALAEMATEEAEKPATPALLTGPKRGRPRMSEDDRKAAGERLALARKAAKAKREGPTLVPATGQATAIPEPHVMPGNTSYLLSNGKTIELGA